VLSEEREYKEQMIPASVWAVTGHLTVHELLKYAVSTVVWKTPQRLGIRFPIIINLIVI